MKGRPMRLLPLGASLTLAAGTLTGLTAAASPAGAAAIDTIRTPGTPSYTVSLTGDATGVTWTGRESVTFTNNSPTGLAEIYLRLWDNAHGTCAAPPISVTNLTGGTAGALSVACTALKVTLPAPVAQNGSATVALLWPSVVAKTFVLPL